jgi:flagellar basal-body rod protein FlgF
MNSGYYSALTGLMAKTQAFDVVANNLANVNTPGYKAQREFYKSLMAIAGDQQMNPLNQAMNNFGVLGGATVDLRPGSLERTSNELDLALEGPGFFAIQTPAGLRYTRNGNFHLNAAGQLVTEAGNPVLGAQGPIELPSGPVSISEDGTVSVSGAVAAEMQLVEFPPGTVLQPEGNSYMIAPDGSGQAASASRVRQGSLEASNINAVEGTVDLITLQRHTEMLQRALNIFHTEFNRTAVEDLPNVS